MGRGPILSAQPPRRRKDWEQPRRRPGLGVGEAHRAECVRLSNAAGRNVGSGQRRGFRAHGVLRASAFSMARRRRSPRGSSVAATQKSRTIGCCGSSSASRPVTAQAYHICRANFVESCPRPQYLGMIFPPQRNIPYFPSIRPNSRRTNALSPLSPPSAGFSLTPSRRFSTFCALPSPPFPIALRSSFAGFRCHFDTLHKFRTRHVRNFCAFFLLYISASVW